MRSPLSLQGTLQAVAEGAFPPAQAVDRCWARAQHYEPDLQAFAFLPEAAPPAGTGPLAGVAVAIKDLIDTADMPTSYGAAVLRGHRPSADAAIVQRLRARGATVIGKTVTTEFAHQQPGPTRNPWNLDHTPGGSSSGSAAAVAAGIVPLAFGTQTMGSVIRPAAFCGIVGFKPTFGTIPRDGVHPLCQALDHVGLFARCVPDVILAMQLLGFLDPGKIGLGRPLRLAALPLIDATIEPAQRHVMDSALRLLRDAGHAVEDLALPSGFDDVPAIVDTLLAYEAAGHFGALVSQHGDAISASIRGLVMRGQGLGAEDYRAALAKQTVLREVYATIAAPYDAVLTIPAAGEAPHGLAWTGDPRFCAPWSVLGVPALTVPVGFGPSGLPLGLQVVGHWGGDAGLLQVGARLADLFPPIHPPPAYGQDFGDSM
ncbi:amidase [Lichenifustis flavocetrariae]|uniref:Amidase n=1 Tax=Lichenifustis flavocetrariae TaxID=2949735 RepID=A0AA41YX74_9HYPH|nr:amidase [Lichenifustis flavocetrariae]MCW6510236.1 amidase [Lichenifustis flavocetrariae]